MRRIETVAVIGAGTMGHALALVHAIGGLRVILQDVDQSRLEAAPALIASALDTLVAAGEVDAELRPSIHSRIGTRPRLEDCIAGADLVVEAVVEDRDVKRSLFAKIDALADADAVIASNTSYLDVFPLIPAARQPWSLIAHWYTPPYIVDLVDIAPGPETDPALIAGLRDLYQRFGKRPVVFEKLIPGYIANRLQAAMNLEAFRLLDEGEVTAKDIDDSVRHGLVLRWSLLGLLMKADYTGLDMTQRSLSNRMYTPPEPRGNSETVDRLVAAGKTGVGVGAGFYDYGDASAASLFQSRDRRLLELKRVLGEIDGEAS